MSRFKQQLENYKKNSREILINISVRKFFIWILVLNSLLFAQTKPIMAVVVDDVGGSLRDCQTLLKIEEPINIAVIPGLAYAQKCAEAINKSPHQLLIHFPWDNLGRKYRKEYPIRIMRGMTKKEMSQMLTLAFTRVPGAQGLNNHMGSQLSVSAQDMDNFMCVLSKFKKDKYFLDSNTARKSCAYYYAKKYGIKTTKNNIFLDGRQSAEYIDKQVKIALQMAKTQGSIVGICHGNRKVTLWILKELLNKYKTEIDFVYLPQLINLREAEELKLEQKKGKD